MPAPPAISKVRSRPAVAVCTAPVISVALLGTSMLLDDPNNDRARAIAASASAHACTTDMQ